MKQNHSLVCLNVAKNFILPFLFTESVYLFQTFESNGLTQGDHLNRVKSRRGRHNRRSIIL